MIWRTSVFLVALTACALLVSGCSKTADPINPGVDDPLNIRVSLVSGYPSVGGSASGVAFALDGTLMSIVDGKLYSVTSPGSDPVLVNSTSTHLKVAVGKTGEVYTVTDSEFRTYALGSQTATVVPYPAGGPLAVNRRVEDAKIVISPSGVPFVTIVNNTPQSYVYFSTDKGLTWQEIKYTTTSGGSISLRSTADVGFMPNGDILLACASTVAGLFKSTDMGQSWKLLSGTIPNASTRMTVASNGDIYTWIPTGGELRVSKDGGASFQGLTPFNAYPFFTHVVVASNTVLYGLAGAAGLLRSTDAGATWNLAIAANGADLAVLGSSIAIAGVANLNNVGGGLTTSSNSGSTWMQSGIRSLQNITGFSLDKDNNLLILGDGTFLRRAGTGWQSLGTNLSFETLATTPTGEILVGAVGALSYSGDNGATWIRSTSFPGYIYTGQGTITIAAEHGRRAGGFLLSVTTYRHDLSQHVNGALYKVGSDGLPVRITSYTGGPVVRIVEDASGNLFVGTSEVDQFTQQFSGETFRSTDGGASWTKTGSVPPSALAVNSKNTALSFGGDTKFILGPLGSTSPTPVTFTGFTSLPQYITKAMFDKNDKLYLLTTDKGLFVSDGPVGAPSTRFEVRP